MENTKRILVVDDDLNIQTLLKTCLRTVGYVVTTARDGRQSLDAVRRHSPDLMLLDIAMPVLDGMSVLVDLRQAPPARMPRVVVMTAHG